MVSECTFPSLPCFWITVSCSFCLDWHALPPSLNYSCSSGHSLSLFPQKPLWFASALPNFPVLWTEGYRSEAIQSESQLRSEFQSLNFWNPVLSVAPLGLLNRGKFCKLGRFCSKRDFCLTEDSSPGFYPSFNILGYRQLFLHKRWLRVYVVGGPGLSPEENFQARSERRGFPNLLSWHSPLTFCAPVMPDLFQDLIYPCRFLFWMRGFTSAWTIPSLPCLLLSGCLGCHLLREALWVIKAGCTPVACTSFMTLYVWWCACWFLSPLALSVPVSFPAPAQAERINEYMMCLLFQAFITCLLQQHRGLTWSGEAFTTDYGTRMVLGLNPKPLDSLPVSFHLEPTEEQSFPPNTHSS